MSTPNPGLKAGGGRGMALSLQECPDFKRRGMAPFYRSET